MSEVAPRASSGMSADAIGQGTSWLELMWGDGVYQFGCDADLGWWVRKEDDPEFLLTAPRPYRTGRKTQRGRGNQAVTLNRIPAGSAAHEAARQDALVTDAP